MRSPRCFCAAYPLQSCKMELQVAVCALVCCSVLQRVAECVAYARPGAFVQRARRRVPGGVAGCSVCCSVCCSVLQCVLHAFAQVLLRGAPAAELQMELQVALCVAMFFAVCSSMCSPTCFCAARPPQNCKWICRDCCRCV